MSTNLLTFFIDAAPTMLAPGRSVTSQAQAQLALNA